MRKHGEYTVLRLLAPYCLLFLPTTDSFPNCMATSQTQKHRYTSRTPCSVLKKHLLRAVAGFVHSIILCQASKSQLHKLRLILIVPTLFFPHTLPVTGPSLQTVLREHSRVTRASKRRCCWSSAKEQVEDRAQLSWGTKKFRDKLILETQMLRKPDFVGLTDRRNS